MSTVRFTGRSPEGAYRFSVEADGQTFAVTASRADGWHCSCGEADCRHIAAVRGFWKRQVDAGGTEPQAQPDRTASDLDRLLEALSRMAAALEKLASQGTGRASALQAPVGAPNLEFPLEEYPGFDWASIGAQVVSRDQHGATVVWWNGALYKRRSPDNRFGKAIWFSRTAGRNEDGTPRYERLVTFREMTDPEPLPERVAAMIGRNGRGR